MERISRSLDKARAQVPSDFYLQDHERTPPAAAEDDPGPLGPAIEVLALQPAMLLAHRIVAWDKRDPRTPAFDMLRTKVVRAMKEQGWRTLAVTSPTHGCGTTTVAINLALSIAHQVYPEVLLVDFDLRHPRIADYLGIHPRTDLSDYLEGRGDIGTCLVNARGLRLRVLPTVGHHQKATELLNSREAESLIIRLKTDPTSRIVIFDLPPLLTTDDALMVIPRVDCVLLVVAENRSTKTEVTAALHELTGSPLIATVLNGSDAKQRPYL